MTFKVNRDTSKRDHSKLLSEPSLTLKKPVSFSNLAALTL